MLSPDLALVFHKIWQVACAKPLKKALPASFLKVTLKCLKSKQKSADKVTQKILRQILQTLNILRK